MKLLENIPMPWEVSAFLIGYAETWAAKAALAITCLINPISKYEKFPYYTISLVQSPLSMMFPESPNPSTTLNGHQCGLPCEEKREIVDISNE